MKHVVILNDLKESDIRPDHMYAQYKQMVQQDIPVYFSNPLSCVEVSCPACSFNKHKRSFLVMGLSYKICSQCDSWYVSPRPKANALATFFNEAPSALFARERFSGSAIPARSSEVFSYRLQWIQDLIEEHCPQATSYVDYGGSYLSFLELLHQKGIFQKIVVFDPQHKTAGEALSPGVGGTEWPLKEGTVDMIAAFEQIERAFSPSELIQQAASGLKKGGLFVLTTATSSGFEYKTLGEHSPNLNPLDRMNLLSFEQILILLRNAGLHVIEASTPGRLDVEIVKKVFLKNPKVFDDGFWSYFFKQGSEEACRQLQEFLQQFQLSSHVRIAAVKQ